MADEIVQKLGLDASGVVSTLKQLADIFGTYAKNVQLAATANAAFSKSGSALLGSIGADAKAVADLVAVLGRLTKAQETAANAAKKASLEEAKAAGQRKAQSRANRLQGALGSELTAGIGDQNIEKANRLIIKIAQIGGRAKLSADQIRQVGQNLGQAFVGPRGQIEALLTRLNALRDVKPPKTAGFLQSLNSQFIGAVTSANLLSNAISKLTQSLIAGVQASIEYEKILARIKTIAGADAGSINQMNIQIRALADEFGRPVAEVAAAQYDLLSNQIGTAAQATNVLTSALKLANVTGSSVPDSVNAISSVINSYNLATSDAAEISAKLFKAVDLGRFTLDEVANSMGRVTVIAAQLGVSIDEVLSALATLTITGIPADEAMTLLSNTMRGLLKPTKDMEEVFSKLGVSTAEAGIAASGGLIPFLERITKIGGETASEIAQLTENVRITRGVLGLTGEQAERAAQNLVKLKAASADLLDQKNQIIIETNAKQIEEELSRLKNFFIVDIGQNALGVINALTQPLGGITAILKAGAVAAALYGASLAASSFNAGLLAAGNAILATSTVTVAAAFGTARAAVLAFIASTGPLAIVALAITALAVTVSNLINRTENAKRAMDELLAARAEDRNKETELAAKTTKREVDGRREAVNKATEILEKYISDAQVLYNENAKNAIASQKLVTDNLKSQLDTNIKAYEQYVEKLKSATKDAAEVQKDVSENVADLTRDVNQNRFSRSQQGLPEQKQIDRALERSLKLRQEATALEFQGTEESRKRAEAVRQEAAALAEGAANSAKALGDRDRLRRSEDAINSTLQQQVAAEQKRAAQAAAGAAAAQQRLAFEQKNLGEIKSLQEQANALVDAAVGTEKLSNEERIAKLREASGIASLIQEKLSEAGDKNVAKQLGLDTLFADIRKPLLDQLGKKVEITTAFQGAAESLQTALNNKEFTVKIKPIIDGLSIASGLDADKLIADGLGLDKIAKAVLEKQKEVNNALTEVAGLDELQAGSDAARDIVIGNMAKIEADFRAKAGLMDSALLTVKSTLTSLGSPAALLVPDSVGQKTQEAAQEFVDAQALVKEAFAAAQAGDTEKVTGFLVKLRELAANSKDNPTLAKSYTELGLAIEGFADSSAKLATSKAQIDAAKATEQQLVTIGGVVAKVQEALAKGGELQAQTGAAATSAATGSASHTKALAAEEAQLKKTAAAQRELNAAKAGSGATPKASGGVVFRSGGGPIYRAAGGAVPSAAFKPRGTDTVPAMLSPGEFVVNARSSRKFFSQLVAMNAGRQPAYRAEGGPVTNVNVGDINVNSQGSNGQVIGRDVWRAIDRAARRGTISRLNRKTRTNK